MKIQKINNSKVRVIIDYKELENNSISIQSFLANSLKTKQLINSIISIINKELHFSKNFDEIKYDILSLQNKVFIIVFTKKAIEGSIFYQFDALEELQNFIQLIKKYIYLETLPYSISSSNNKYFIKFDISNKSDLWKNNFLSVLSEFK